MIESTSSAKLTFDKMSRTDGVGYVPPTLTSTHNDGYEVVAYGKHTDEPVNLGSGAMSRKPAETHKRSEKVTIRFEDYVAEHRKDPVYAELERAYHLANPTVVIEFERMGFVGYPVTIRFQRCIELIACCVTTCHGVSRGLATCKPEDTFSWEIGIRNSLRQACYKKVVLYGERMRFNAIIYRAFRRWMWLAKDHYWWTQLSSDLMMPLDETRWAAETIAREFGRVKVRVT